MTNLIRSEIDQGMDVYKKTLDAATNTTIPMVLLGMTFLSVIFTIGHLTLLDGTVQRIMLLSSGFSTLLFFSLWLKIRTRGPFPDSWAHGISLIIVLFIVFSSLLHLVVTRDPIHSTHIGIIIIAVGCFYISLRWFVVTLLFIWFFWVISIAPFGNTDIWAHYGFMNTIASLIAFLVIRHHRRLVIDGHNQYLSQVELTSQMSRVSKTDALTGLPNRRAFDEALEIEWQRCGRSEGSLACLMLDVDFFKGYNDYYGHPEGDNCLIRIGNMLQNEFQRSIDFFGRYGGEEFIALLPETSQQEAVILAERCRAVVLAEGIPHNATSVDDVDSVTISVGVACLVPKWTMPPHVLITLADNALYLAKKKGRNCFVAEAEVSTAS